MEQEKHILRRKVDAVEGEYESKVSELQSDVADLRRLLEEQTTNVKIAERQKSSIITQLTEQNQRLTAQLKEVKKLDPSILVSISYRPTNRDSRVARVALSLRRRRRVFSPRLRYNVTADWANKTRRSAIGISSCFPRRITV